MHCKGTWRHRRVCDQALYRYAIGPFQDNAWERMRSSTSGNLQTIHRDTFMLGDLMWLKAAESWPALS